MADLLFDIKHVFNGYLKEGQRYNIPEYQRGYKWNSQQITQLIEDINEFETEGDDDLFYCLQNITLVESPDDRTKINIVDGQQRLTTIILLLAFLDDGDRIEDKLIYSVREPSNNFLQSLITDQELRSSVLASAGFDDFLEEYDEIDYDFQDIYFMFNAYRTFSKWFEENKDVSQELYHVKLLTQVKLIVNRVEGISEQELFINLNAGQVHLDGSDLIRAILITRVAKQEMEEYDSDNVEDVLRLNERRLRIGWELDELNAWWSQPEIREYFGSFCSISTAPQETIQFKENVYPINLLYKLWAETNGKNDIRLSWFETKSTSALDLYTSIIKTHRVLKDWYNDRFIYHLLGYLFTNYHPNFKVYWDFWSGKNQTREKFTSYLKSQVNKFVFGEEPNEDNQETGIEFWLYRMINFDSSSPNNWYESDKLEKILILLDVIAHSKETVAGNPLPFLSPKYFANQKEDKEHIYPGTPKQLEVLKALDRPIVAINDYINQLNEGYEDELVIDNWEIIEEEWSELESHEQEERRVQLKNKIHNKRPINSIGNLVLLHRSINRSFGNDYYNDKRAMVVQNAKNGEYIRQHTLNVFVKNIETDNLNVWTMDDILTNARNIHDFLVVFFGVEFNQEVDEN